MHTPKPILTILSIFLFANLAFSQVVIKDTIAITPKGDGKIPLSISNPQYYAATITISCDALNSTRDPLLPVAQLTLKSVILHSIWVMLCSLGILAVRSVYIHFLAKYTAYIGHADTNFYRRHFLPP